MAGRRPDLDDLDDEIRAHIEAETQDNVARGMSEAAARAAAMRAFGNVARVKEEVRAVWMPAWLDSLQQDARDAVRTVRSDRPLAAAVVVTLALGIGLTTAVYSVVDAVLVRPLAYAHPERMVWLSTRAPDSSRETMNSIDFAAWQAQATTLGEIVAYEAGDATVAVGGDASRWRIVSASTGFWEVTGARPELGTLPGDTNQEALAITHQAFVEQFHGDPAVIGRMVSLDGRPAAIAAVLPASFHPQLQAFGVIVALDAAEPSAYRLMRVEPPPPVVTPMTGVRIYQALGELKDGVTLDQARAEIEAIHARHQREHPTPLGATSAVVLPLQDQIVGPARRALEVLLSASFVVLLIACANIANLLLSRVAERRKEIALRMAVGSGPLRIVRQLLAESLAYAAAGGVGGVLLSLWLVHAVAAVVGNGVPWLAETRLDGRVLAVAAGLTIGTALLFGLAPAFALLATNVQEVLKDGGRLRPASRRVVTTGRAMVMAQVALTVVLLAGAGLMLKSVWRMTRYPDGFAPDRILTLRLDIRGPQYRDQGARQAFAAALVAAAHEVPGVRDAAITTGRGSLMLVVKEGEGIPPPAERARRSAAVSAISGGFGPLLGMSLAAGRWFDERDARGMAIINESLARRDFNGTDPIGRRIRMPWLGENGMATIVGVVRDLKYAVIDQDAAPEVFFRYTDTPISSLTLVLRVEGDPLAVAPDARRRLAAVDPTQSIYDVRALEDVLSATIAPRRLNLLLLGTFALVALTLAALGTYSVVAYAVAERRHEIGVRMALGAQRATVVRAMLGYGLRSVVAGLVAGLFAAWAATRTMAGLLYDVPPHDAATFAVVLLMFGVVGTVACVMPARRAATIDPAAALRAE